MKKFVRQSEFWRALSNNFESEDFQRALTYPVYSITPSGLRPNRSSRLIGGPRIVSMIFIYFINWRSLYLSIDYSIQETVRGK